MNFREDLKAFLDGELPPERMAEIHEEIARNPALARDLSEMRALVEALRQGAYSPTVVGLEETLAALQRREPRKRVWWLSLPLGLAGAGLLAIVAYTANLREGASDASSDSVMSKVAMTERQRPEVAGAAAPTEMYARKALGEADESAKSMKKAPPKMSETARTPDERTVSGVKAKSEGAKAADSSQSKRYRDVQPQKHVTPVEKASKPLAAEQARTDSQAPAESHVAPKREDTAMPMLSYARTKAAPAPPVVLQVASIEDAEAKVKTLGYEVATNELALDRAPANEKQLILRVPLGREAEVRAQLEKLLKEPPHQDLRGQASASGGKASPSPVKELSDASRRAVSGALASGGGQTQMKGAPFMAKAKAPAMARIVIVLKKQKEDPGNLEP